MPRYRLNSPTFINNALRDPGAEVDYAGWPGSTLEPADAVAGRVKAFYDVARKGNQKTPDAPDLSKFGEPAAVAEKPAEPAAAVPADPPTPAIPASSATPPVSAAATAAAKPARTPRVRAKKPPARAGHTPPKDKTDG